MIVNTRIMSHPMNWVTLAVWLIAIAVLAHIINVLPDNILHIKAGKTA